MDFLPSGACAHRSLAASFSVACHARSREAVGMSPAASGRVAQETLDTRDPQPRDANGHRAETSNPTERHELRLITYLAPGLPLGLFEAMGEYLGSELELSATLESETSVSAPSPGEPDPFSNDGADIGFLCAPGYFWLSERTPPAVALVPAAFHSTIHARAASRCISPSSSCAVLRASSVSRI